MNDVKVLTVGGSRNIGYFSSIRLLGRRDIRISSFPDALEDSGATVTFLLRTPSVFDKDETVQGYVRSGKARLVQGDALVKEDVQRAWTEARRGGDDTTVDFLLFTVGE